MILHLTHNLRWPISIFQIVWSDKTLTGKGSFYPAWTCLNLPWSLLTNGLPNLTEYIVELHDVDDPGTETGCCQRLGANKLRIEVFVIQVRLNRFLTDLGDVLLVVVD